MNHRKPFLSRWAHWAFVAALLLKAATPLLATASAHAQGKTLVEVCTVYGVALVALESPGQQPAPEPMAKHGGEHCALTALAVAVASEPSPAAVTPMPQRQAATAPAHPAGPAPDACATWVARLRHGPPTFS